MRRSTSDLLLAAVALSLIGFYFWTASNGYSFREAPRDGYYNLLTAAFMAGQLHLQEEPRPEMFELAEPYEPGRNARFRLHDASLYHGKYYLYFGVVPALTLFVPWRLLGLGELAESLAAALFATGGLLFWVAILRRLLREHCPDTPGWMQAGAALVLGVSSVVPFILRSPSVYEVAVSGGYFFLAGASYFFFTADGGFRLRLGRLGLGSLFLGLAAGCRPNLLAVAPILPLLALPAWRLAPSRRRALAALTAPLALCVLLWGLYNHARFGSWTEFGTTYQVAGLRPVPWFDPAAVPVAFYFHFLAPPDLRLEFPLVFPLTDYPGEAPEGFFKAPFTTGLLAHAPFILILLFAPRLLRHPPVEAAARLRWRLGVLVAAGLLLPLLTSLAFSAAAMRYEVDFASLLLVPALVVLVVADRRASRRGPLRAASVLGLAWSVLAGTALSLHGDVDGLRLQNPGVFAALERRFEPLRIALGRLLVRDDHAVFRMRIALPERAAAEREPVFTSGTGDRSDVLWSRQAGPGLFAFELQPVQGPVQTSRPLPLTPGRFYDLELELDYVKRFLRARIDGQEAFRFEARVGTVHARRRSYGRGPRGRGATFLGRFSGTIIPEPMLWAGRPGLESLPSLAPLPAVLTDTAQEDDRPPSPPPGLLWIPVPKEGAYLWTGAEWRWIPRVYVDRVRVDRSIAFAVLPPGTVEPLVVSGDSDGADAVFVRHLGGGRAAPGLAHWRGAWKLDPPGDSFPVAPERTRRLDIVLDRAGGAVSVRLDGRDAFRGSADLAPIDRSLVVVGRSPEGLILGRGLFAGRIGSAH